MFDPTVSILGAQAVAHSGLWEYEEGLIFSSLDSFLQLDMPGEQR